MIKTERKTPKKQVEETDQEKIARLESTVSDLQSALDDIILNGGAL